jgi:hypothetical protein
MENREFAILMSKLPSYIHWGGKKWARYPKMRLIWDGNAGQLPIELVFGNYVLRSAHSMIWVHLVDEEKGEPFDIWEIRILKNESTRDDDDNEEVLEEDDWDNVLIENGCDVHSMVKFLKRCIFEDKMAIYIQPRKAWDRAVAEQWESTHQTN